MKSLDELQALAAAATPGPWHVDQDDRPGMEWNRSIDCDAWNSVCFMTHSEGKDPARDEATAAYIAAFSPDVGAALVAVARAAKDLEAKLPIIPRSLDTYTARDELMALRAALAHLEGAK